VRGGGLSKISALHFGCSTARNKGETACGNQRVIRRDVLEQRSMRTLANACERCARSTAATGSTPTRSM
jgi:hypothetical protein